MIEVIGIGNILFGDDAAGVYAVRELCKRFHGENDIEFIEGETDIYYCIECVQKLTSDDLIVIIDACDFDKKCGTVFIERLESYDKYLREMVESHEDSLIKIMRRDFKYMNGFVINIQIHDASYRIGLSRELEDMFNKICNKVFENLKK